METALVNTRIEKESSTSPDITPRNLATCEIDFKNSSTSVLPQPLDMVNYANSLLRQFSEGIIINFKNT